MASNCKELENTIEKLVEIVRQVQTISSDFQPQGQNYFNSKVQAMVQGLREIDSLRSQVSNVTVPWGVLEYIDTGLNPTLYNKDFMEATLAKNEQVNGKIQELEKLRANLLLELTKVQPTATNMYRALREKKWVIFNFIN